MNEKVNACAVCSKEFIPNKFHKYQQRYCSKNCRKQVEYKKNRSKHKIKTRKCRHCGTAFAVEAKEHNNKWLCSDKCKRLRKKWHVAQFAARNPHQWCGDGTYKRLSKKYPNTPTACESCGEDRAVEVAHKPEHKRNGKRESKSSINPNHIWILCPTCHTLLDRKGYSPKELGLY